MSKKKSLKRVLKHSENKEIDFEKESKRIQRNVREGNKLLKKEIIMKRYSIKLIATLSKILQSNGKFLDKLQFSS